MYSIEPSTRNGVSQKIEGHLTFETYEQVNNIYDIERVWAAVSNG